MKKFSLSCLFLVAIALPTQAQIELGIGYGYSRPSAQMAQNIRAVHQMNLSVGCHINGSPLVIGAEIGLGGYGYQSQRQTYTFSDGSTTETNVNVSNNTFNAMLFSRLYYPQASILQPYVQVRGGLSTFYTSLTIEDPQDVDDCHPLESDILKSSSNCWI